MTDKVPSGRQETWLAQNQQPMVKGSPRKVRNTLTAASELKCARIAAIKTFQKAKNEHEDNQIRNRDDQREKRQFFRSINAKRKGY